MDSAKSKIKLKGTLFIASVVGTHGSFEHYSEKDCVCSSTILLRVC